LDAYVRVTGTDWTRLGDLAERVAYFADNRAFMRMVDGHCAALILRDTEDGGSEFFCSIYERRPQVCRDLARGSPECDGERALKGGRVTSAAAERDGVPVPVSGV
jgi:Fe-S-cluster containining protein